MSIPACNPKTKPISNRTNKSTRTTANDARTMFRILFKLLFCGGLTYIVWHIAVAFGAGFGPIGLAMTSVVWGTQFSSEIIRLFSEIRYWARWSVFHHWQGHYYHFDGVHLRFYMMDEVIWIAIKELHVVIEPGLEPRELRLLGEEYGQIPSQKEIGITEAGLLRVLGLRTERRHAAHKMIRFRNWLINSTFLNLRRLPKSAARIN